MVHHSKCTRGAGAPNASYRTSSRSARTKTPDVQTQAPIKGEASHNPEEHIATRSSNRVFTGKASFYSYKTGRPRAGQILIAICQPPRTAACHSARKCALLILPPAGLL
jgi:hypothetical protein